MSATGSRRAKTAPSEVSEQYSSFVYGLALRVVGDLRAAEDIAQDGFLFVWERPEVFDRARGSLRTWLGTLAHRRAVGYVRRDEARRRRTQREVVLTGDGAGDWRVRMGPDVERDAEPDRTVTADVVDWCRVASERLRVADLHPVVDGDERLAEDLLVAASAFVTL